MTRRGVGTAPRHDRAGRRERGPNDECAASVRGKASRAAGHARSNRRSAAARSTLVRGGRGRGHGHVHGGRGGSLGRAYGGRGHGDVHSGRVPSPEKPAAAPTGFPFPPLSTLHGKRLPGQGKMRPAMEEGVVQTAVQRAEATSAKCKGEGEEGTLPDASSKDRWVVISLEKMCVSGLDIIPGMAVSSRYLFSWPDVGCS